MVTLDTADSGQGDLGLVAVVPVGMSQVSSVNLAVVKDTIVAKGDEFGYFLFGGSDIILLFQEGVAQAIDTRSDFRFYGLPVARAKAAD